MKIDPIIAVKNVQNSSLWYQSIFDCKSIHGGDEFDVLVDEKMEVILCLHKWGEHDHPSMKSGGNNVGNGLILYFRVKKIETIRTKLKSIKYKLESELQLSPNSNRREFSLRDPDGYYITVAEYHDYKG